MPNPPLTPITNQLSVCSELPTGETWNSKLYFLIMRSMDWYVFQVSCETSRSLWFGSSLMRAEQEPDPRGRVWLDLFRADSKSSRSPPNWKSLNVQTQRQHWETKLFILLRMTKIYEYKKLSYRLHEAKWVEREWSSRERQLIIVTVLQTLQLQQRQTNLT